MLHAEKGRVCGLLGRTLGHSFSPQIHKELADYEYRLFEVEPEQLGAFLESGSFDAINVTIPYKQAVIPYLSRVSDRAARIGAVNTILRQPDGSLVGDNTDYDGFAYLLRCSGIDVAGKKVLVLGSGGASRTAVAVLTDLGAREVLVISRHGDNTYEGLDRHADADVIVNTTPVGMYPNNGQSPVSLSRFPRLSGVVDVVYNPARTAILLEAQKRRIPNVNGLPMLVAQAKRAAELFLGASIPDGEIDRIVRHIAFKTSNLVLVGMPGCGKSTVGALCAEALGRPFLDTDSLFLQKTGMTAGAYITAHGEAAFRKAEHDCVREAGSRTGVVIATGGGVVTLPENYAPLHQNGTIVFLSRPVDQLPTDGRPLSAGDLNALYQKRLPLYQSFADATVSSQPDVADTVRLLLEAYQS